MNEAQSVGAPNCFSFGPFRILVRTRAVLKGEEQLPLGARAFDLLHALVSRAGQIVSREDLTKAAWPTTSVSENNLAVHIAAIRRALGDDGLATRYITNLPGRGYVFVAPVVAADDAPLDALDPLDFNERGNLPVLLTRVIGREDAIDALVLRSRDNRLLSVVGTGGIGKTTAAVAAAAQLRPEFSDGVIFVDLSPLSSGDLVASAIAQALGLKVEADGAEITIINHIRARHVLLVLDNCEHVIDAVASVAAEVLRRAPSAHILATSREALSLAGESIYRLAPLTLPDASDPSARHDVLQFAAPQMFAAVAASASGVFELTDANASVVADICRRLDGIPLAIELAASRVDFFGLKGLSQRLDESLSVLSTDGRAVAARQQTLQSTLDWSYQLLTPVERWALRRLSIFRGRFSLTSALAMTSSEQDAEHDEAGAFVSLIAKSLVSVDGRSGPPEYRLNETTRAYALEKTREAGELEALTRDYAQHVLDVLTTRDGNVKPISTSMPYLLDDVRASAEWALADHDIRMGCEIIIASADLWIGLLLPAEFFRWANRAVKAASLLVPADAELEMRLANVLANADLENGFSDVAKTALLRALTLAEAMGDAGQELISLSGLFQKTAAEMENETASTYAARIGDAARRAGHPAPHLIHATYETYSRFFTGEPAASLDVAEATLPQIPPRPPGASALQPFENDPRIGILTNRARVNWICGWPDRALDDARTALDEARKLDHLPSFYLILTSGASSVALWRRDLPFAEELLAITTRYTESLKVEHWKIWQRTLEIAISPLRSPDGSAAHSDLAPREMEITPYARALLCTVHEAHRSPWLEQRLLRDDAHWSREEFDRVAAVRQFRTEGAQGAAGAEQRLRAALTRSEAKGARGWALRAATSLAELMTATGKGAEGREILEPLYATFTEGFETHDLQRARAALAAAEANHP